MLLTIDDIKYMVTESVRRVTSGNNGLSSVISSINGLESFNDKDKVVSRYYRELGRGIDRVVYQVDDYLVLKLGDSGVRGQNYLEWLTWDNCGRSPLLPKIYWCARDFSWLVSEYALPAKRIDFINLLGVRLFANDTYSSVHPERNLDYIKSRMDSDTDWVRDKARAEYDDAMDSITDRQTYYDYFGRDRIDSNEEDVFDTELSIEDFVDRVRDGESLEDYYSLKSGEWFREFGKLVEYGVDDFHSGNFGLVRRNGKECIVVIDAGVMDL